VVSGKWSWSEEAEKKYGELKDISFGAKKEWPSYAGQRDQRATQGGGGLRQRKKNSKGEKTVEMITQPGW